MTSLPLRWLGMLSPWLLIGGLAYAALFIKLEATESSLEQPLLEKRDRFFGAAASGETMWFVGGDGVLLETFDAGQSWDREELPGEVNLQATAASPTGVRVVVGNHAEVFVGELGQDGWKRYQLPQEDYASKLNQVRFIDGHFWVVGEMGGIYQLSADGLTWKDYSLGKDLSVTNISGASDGSLWLTAEYGNLFRSQDHGGTWKQINLSSETLRSIAFHDQQAVAVGNGGQVFYSGDLGESWQLQPVFTEEHLYDVAWNDDQWIVVGDQGQMFTAQKPNAQWSRVESPGMSKTYFTSVLPVDGGVVLAGKTLGFIDKNNNWADWPAGDHK